jgi:hypothetical protein
MKMLTCRTSCICLVVVVVVVCEVYCAELTFRDRLDLERTIIYYTWLIAKCMILTWRFVHA